MGFLSKLRPDPTCWHGKVVGACRDCARDKAPGQGQYRNGRKVGSHAGVVDKRGKGKR